jgi:hypothetical protein
VIVHVQFGKASKGLQVIGGVFLWLARLIDIESKGYTQN